MQKWRGRPGPFSFCATNKKCMMNDLDYEAPRTVQLIVHARVFTLVDGWTEISDEPELFQFDCHAFNFDYLLHLSGINYLIHPDDSNQIIALVKEVPDEKLQDYRFRFINRSGEVKTMQGSGRLIPELQLVLD